MANARGKGPNGSWKTGQRVPFTDYWVDQYGVTSWHEAHGTFPPCIGRKGENANRTPAPARSINKTA